MPQNQMTSYFTDYELSSIINKTCPKSKKKRHFFSERNCCIGSLSHGSDGNLWNYPSYCTKKINYTLRLQYPHKRAPYTMEDIFWKLKNRSTIILLGDSVQNQVFDGMTCDLLRNNITLETLADINMNKLTTNWTIEEGKRGFKYTLFRNRRHNRTFKAYRINAGNITTHMINVLYLRTYRPNIFQYTTFCEWADVYLLNWDLHYDLDRTSIKYELWKEEIGGILKLIENCFRTHMKTQQSLPIFIWRGTAAQHFSHIGGYYEHGVIYNEPNKNSFENIILVSNIDDKYREWAVGEYDSLSDSYLTNNQLWDKFLYHTHERCYPLYFEDESYENYLWRERLINFVKNRVFVYDVQMVYPGKEISVHLKGNDRYFLYFIPFKELTNSLWWMHDPYECTHYCSSPNLWEFIWDEMYRIIDGHNLEKRILIPKL